MTRCLSSRKRTAGAGPAPGVSHGVGRTAQHHPTAAALVAAAHWQIDSEPPPENEDPIPRPIDFPAPDPWLMA